MDQDLELQPLHTAAAGFNLDDMESHHILQRCERKKHADPWNHLLIHLSRQARRNIPPGYPLKLKSYQSTPSMSPSSSSSHDDQKINSDSVHVVPADISPTQGGPLSVQDSNSTKNSSSSKVFSDKSSNMTLSTELPSDITLWCEHRDLLGCPVEFSVEDQDAWIEHHKEHLGHKYPPLLACWMCGERTFIADIYKGLNAHNEHNDPNQRQVVNEKNFERRMKHIAHHITLEISRPVPHEFDILLLDFMKENGFINAAKYESAKARGKHSMGERRLQVGWRDDICAIALSTEDSGTFSSRAQHAEENDRNWSSDDARLVKESSFGLDQLELVDGITSGVNRQARMRQEAFLTGIGPTRFGDVPEREARRYRSRYFSDFVARDNGPTIYASKNQSARFCPPAVIVKSAAEASNEFMFSFNNWLDWTSTAQSEAISRGSTSDRSGSKCSAAESDNTGNRTGNRHYSGLTPVILIRKRTQDRNEDGGGGDKKRPNKGLSTNVSVEKPRFACPYLKHDPFGANRERCHASWKMKYLK